MKTIKYFVIALGIVAILASMSWVLRNSIIQRMSGPILSDYGMAITDVSLDALATENATISYLELEHENGTTIAIDNLILPIGTSSTSINPYAADKVTITLPSETDAEPLALARLIDQLLSLPIALPNAEVIVTELNVAPYPIVRDLRWTSTEEQQELTASLGAVALTAQIIVKDQVSFEGKFSLKLTSMKTPELSITTDIRRSDSGINISAASVLDLPITAVIATSIAASLGSTPAGVEFTGGAAIIELTAEIPYETNQQAKVIAYLTPAAPFELAYSVKSGVVNVVSIHSASPIKLEATYPDTQWSVSEEHASLLLSFEEWHDISISITNLICASGPSCFMNLDVSMDNADLTFATASRLELAASQDVVFGKGTVQVFIRPDAELSLIGLSVSDTELASLDVVLMSAATLELADTGWGFTAELIDADVESLSLDDETQISATLSLRKLSVSDLDQSMSMNVAVDLLSGQLTWKQQVIPFPGLSGTVSLQDEDVMAELTIVGRNKEATIQAEHNLHADTGQISIVGASLSFDSQKLSRRISPWTDDWDITAGTVAGELQLNWQIPDSGWLLDGQASLTMTDLAGAFSDTAFAGLSTSIEADFDTATGITVEPAHIEIDLVEIGLPIENITADYILNTNALSVAVKNLQMHAFGGVIQADPFTYDLESERNSLLLRAESIELTELLTLKEFEAIELTGSIGAELPVIIEGDAVTIMDGTLIGEAPGGVIRYKPDIVPDDGGTSGIGLVTRALSNFEYETLTSTVGYSKDGDLVLQLQLAGRNPDFEDNRPVVLNLGIENNVPQMLKSLQAARAVEEILEKRLRK